MRSLDDPQLMREIIMDHYQHPRNRGLTDDSSYVSVNMNSDTCIDNLDIQVKFDGDNLIVLYPQGIKSVTPGQEAVFYLDGVCLGGGTIDKVYRNNKQIIYK